MFLPIISVIIIAFLTTHAHNTGIKGFALFTLGGITFSTHNIMYLKNLGESHDHNLHEFILGLLYAIFEDAPQLLYQTLNTIYLG